MIFSFNPKTDEEIAALQNQALMPNGTYSFSVKGYSNTPSKKTGNPMLTLTLAVIDHEGKQVEIKDFFVNIENMAFKLKHFCASIGMSEAYESGNLDPHLCIGKKGKLMIGTQKGKEKPDGTGFFNDKNCVKDYVQKVEQTGFVDDIIPF